MLLNPLQNRLIISLTTLPILTLLIGLNPHNILTPLIPPLLK